MAVSGNLEGKTPIVDDVLSSHEQKIYPNTSIDENCIEFVFPTDRFYYVDLRQTSLVLKLKLVRGRGYETYNTKELKKKETKKRRRGKSIRGRQGGGRRSNSSRYSCKQNVALIFIQC